MATSYKELVQETFSDVTTLTPDKLNVLVEETMRYFQEMQEKLASGEADAKEQVLRESIELKQILEKQMATLCDASGLSPAQLAAYAEHGTISPQEKLFIEDVKKKFQTLMPKKAEKGRKKRKHLKIIG